MHLHETSLPGVQLLEPTTYADERGWFTETFNARSFEAAGLPQSFAQDNQSFSKHGVLRGLHYQVEEPQGKLIRCLNGHIWDVAVDLRRSSSNFGKWTGFDLYPYTKDGKMRFLWIPEGFAHGFLTLSETAEVQYKTTRFYYPQGERTIRWDDETLAIAWPLDFLQGKQPIVSAKDAVAPSLHEVELFA
jgi:dTDP-4-dehydrorhamnose 3,5-epimerase